MPPTQTGSAILFILFNRPDTTARVFEKIREARPSRLYIAADGPRETKSSDAETCQQARMAAGPIDWPCKVQTLIREKNLGCKDAVSSAIGWFFQHEEQGIILEDDCLPSPDFFHFCDTLLAHHRNNPRIRHICGCNFQFGQQRGEASYYFSKLTHVWGWASWRRAWQSYDKDLSKHTAAEFTTALKKTFDDPLIVDRWDAIAAALRNNKINTWDYQLSLTNIVEDGLCIIPNANLITNIGFGHAATHTNSTASKYADIPHAPLGPVTHPNQQVADAAADRFTLEEEFQLPVTRELLKQKALKYNRVKYRFKRWLAAHGGPSRWHSAGS